MQSPESYARPAIRQGPREGHPEQERSCWESPAVVGWGRMALRERCYLWGPLKGQTGPGHEEMNGATFLEEGMARVTDLYEVGKSSWTVSRTSHSSWGLQCGRGHEREQWNSMLGNSF